MAISGCCGPRCCGIGCATNCGGCGPAIASPCGCGGRSCGAACGGPLVALQNARRSLICGSGCCEAYIGEWTSTPPDCNDPCYDGQFIGGAVKARPFCRPNCGCRLSGLYGKRNCSGAESSVPCGCGEVTCGGCDVVDYSTTEYVVDEYSEVIPAGVQEGGCGCASCSAKSPMATRLASMEGGSSTKNSITAAARSKKLTQRAERIRR